MKCSGSILVFLLISLINAGIYGQQGSSGTLLHDELSKYGQAEIEFANPGRELLNRISERISIWHVGREVVKASVSPRDTAYLATFPLKYTIVPKAVTKAVESALTADEAMGWNLYPTYQQYDTIMHRFASQWPELCRVDTIGYSIEGRLILALVISDNIALTEPGEPAVFLSSTMHGDELGGYVLLLRFAHFLLSEYGSGSKASDLVDSLVISINPLANPDGTYYGGDTISTPSRYNSNSIDLNRNFPDPTRPDLVQQPENVAMISYLEQNRFAISANFHSGAEVLNFPWDRSDAWSDGQHADSLWFFDICRQYIDTLRLYAIPEYMSDYYGTSTFPGVVRGDDWYSITGSRQDYVTYQRQGREVTFEIDNMKQTPSSQLQDLWEYNHRSLVNYIGSANYGIHGRVFSTADGSPLPARIYIAGHDRDSSMVYSDTVSGHFVRLLRPGIWSFAVSSPGYFTRWFDNITVEEFVQRHIEIGLDPDASTIRDLYGERLRLWPVPADSYLRISLPGQLAGGARVRIISAAGLIVSDSECQPSGDGFIEIGLEKLAPGFYHVELSHPGKNQSYTGRFIKR